MGVVNGSQVCTAMRKAVAVLFMLAVCWLSSYPLDAQNRIISVDAENEPVTKVLRDIEQSSGFRFFYNNINMDRDQRVSVSAENEDIIDVLYRIFAGTGTEFTIMGSNIILSKAESVAMTAAKDDGRQEVSGTVTDAAGEPLPGVTVFSEADPKASAVTDLDGRFSLDAAKGDMLTVSIMGYLPAEIYVGGRTSDVRLTLEEDIKMLDEVIVVGYGVQRRSDVTGAISTVKAEQANKIPTTSVAEMLRGAAPGLQVNLGSAEPGGTSSVLIRGRRSLSGDNDPLYVVDGVPMSSIDDVNSSEIESIEVLKDASSQAIYGARAANGVILITTKRGVAGRVKVSYNGYVAVQQIDRNFEFYNGEEWAAYRHEAYYNANGYYDEQDCFRGLMLDVLNSGEYVNWEDLMISPAVQHKHDVLVQGGSDKTKFALGLGYFNQDGMVLNSGFKKFSGRLNVDQKLGNHVTVGANISFSRGWKQTADGSFNSFVTMPPLAKVYEDDGVTLREDVTEAGESHYNPLWNINNSKNESIQDRLLINLFADWNIWRGLSYRLNASMSTRRVNSNSYQGLEHTTGRNTQGKATLSESFSDDYLLENILNYTHDFNSGHHIDATLMQSINLIEWKRMGLNGTGFANDDLAYNAIGSALEYGKPTYELSKRSMVSFLARIRYSYKERYLLTLAMRADGSSVFGANNKYGFFPSAAFAWRINNEEFLKNTGWLTNLKLRLSWGQVGNQGISPYTTLGLTDEYFTEFGSTTSIGYLPGGTLWNPDLKWETSTSANIGIDFGFLDDRITGSFEVYDTETSDLLVTKSLNQSLGYTNQLVNLGRVQNKGVEIMLNTVPVTTDDFQWTVDLSWSKNVNRIKVIDGETDENGNPRNDINNRWFIGHPINVYYDYEFDGIWQTGDDIASSHMPDANPGDIRIKDTDQDGKITESDRVIMNRDPDWIGSVTMGFYYKGFDLSGDLYVSYGGTMYNSYLTSFDTGGDMTGKRNGIRRNYWTLNNPSNEAPAPNMTQAPAYINALGYQDATYVRLRNVTFGYTFPQKMIQKIRLQNLRLYLSFTNLWTYTEVLGYGPEQTPGDYPEPRTMLFGLKVTF